MSESESHPGKVQKLVSLLESALGGLGIGGDPDLVETAAVAVYQSMTAGGRNFHNLDHVFSFDGPDPLATLAALYHDVVYWGVDGGWPRPFAGVLAAAAPDLCPGTPLARDCPIPFYREILVLFGAEPGGPVPVPGANELFSALALASALGGVLGRDRTLAAAACIEATLSFRGPRTGEDLHRRLTALGYPGTEADPMVGRALLVACQDVADFRHEDPGVFLSGTWRLLAESNPGLRAGGQDSFLCYRKALAGMAGFFASLTPERIFPRWKDSPAPEVHERWLAAAGRNLRIAGDYLSAKLLAVALLEAVARSTGGDVPLPLFLGGVAEPGAPRMTDRLPPVPGSPDDPVHRLLAVGRRDDASFERKDSPLAAFLHGRLSPDDRARERARMAEFFAGQTDPAGYLAGWHPVARTEVVPVLAAFVPTRKARILSLAGN